MATRCTHCMHACIGTRGFGIRYLKLVVEWSPNELKMTSNYKGNRFCFCYVIKDSPIQYVLKLSFQSNIDT